MTIGPVPLGITVMESAPWLQQLRLLPELAVALVLSLAIGLERQLRSKQAGVRTYCLVGIGSALFMLVSKYGFSDLLGVDGLVLDPSRIAAQIVSGVGFLGAGLIIIRSEAVRGLTTAASIWLTAAVGMAAGGKLFILAFAVTASYFLVVAIGPRLNRLRRVADQSVFRIEYLDGHGLLRDIMKVITDHRWQIARLQVGDGPATAGHVAIYVTALGGPDAVALVDTISAVEGVRSATWLGADESGWDA